ncbi:MAG: hypothetical protein VB093_05710 [Propionicimonas sp.]|nr:hypothetical protein [Propionicimonas sp.]
MSVRVSSGNVSATVHRRGGMVTATFAVGGVTVSPLHEAPWAGYPADPLLDQLKGDFVCVPFGIAPASLAAFPPEWAELAPGKTQYGHGYAATHEWEVEHIGAGSARLRVQYPDDDPVEWVAREVSCTDSGVEVRDEVAVLRDARLPLGLHPMLHLPGRAGGARLVPPACEAIVTFPAPVDASSILQPNAAVADLASAPLQSGGTIDLTSLPLAVNTEELLMLCNVTTSSARLDNHEEGYRVTLSWDSTLLKHCLLWFSNRGRSTAPWDGRNLCLGIEPVTSAFDLGTVISTTANPLSTQGLSTAVDLGAGQVHSVSHTLSVEPL